MSKEIHCKILNGEVDAESAPNRGVVNIITGEEAVSAMVGELQERFEKELNDRPTLVLKFSKES
jgi:hypothetical protein